MEARIQDYPKFAPESFKTMLALSAATKNSSLEPKLLELVKIRASQINGCAYCLDMHTQDARAIGETEQRINLLSAWREAPFYTDRERAALGWTEAVTKVADTHVPDYVYNEVRARFSEKETVELNWAVVTINAWNRVAVSFRIPAGTYTPPKKS
ncbi:MAG TPA: carboxymuconolactone decarboxylase family protein [Planctomycetota bacterium]|nr:carboxymuconolactone decarboxylase family protein [Planctomycetota bacterium]